MDNLCRQCGENALIKAHLFPQAAIRGFRQRGPDKKTMAVFHDRAIPANKPNGLFDPNILCKTCDNKIGEADKWFLENFQKFHDTAKNRRSYSVFDVPIDPIMAIRFSVSVIYRTALSRIDQFSQISLGPYSKTAGKIAIGEKFEETDIPIVIVNTLTSKQLDTRQFAFYPVRCSAGTGIYFTFALSGLQFLVKFGGDSGRISSDDPFSSFWRLYPERIAKSICYPFEESAEAVFMFEAARRQAIRSSERD